MAQINMYVRSVTYVHKQLYYNRLSRLRLFIFATDFHSLTENRLTIHVFYLLNLYPSRYKFPVRFTLLGA